MIECVDVQIFGRWARSLILQTEDTVFVVL